MKDIIELNGVPHRKVEVHYFEPSNDIVKTAEDMTIVVDDKYEIKTKLVRLASNDESIQIYGEAIRSILAMVGEIKGGSTSEDFDLIDLTKLSAEYRTELDKLRGWNNG